MSNDLSANMRRANADRQRAERRRANIVERARALAEKHREEIEQMVRREAPATFLQQDMMTAYMDEAANPVVEDLAQAIRLTVEYVGNDTLPALPGWSWFDVLKRYRPDLAEEFQRNPIRLAKGTSA